MPDTPDSAMSPEGGPKSRRRDWLAVVGLGVVATVWQGLKFGATHDDEPVKKFYRLLSIANDIDRSPKGRLAANKATKPKTLEIDINDLLGSIGRAGVAPETIARFHDDQTLLLNRAIYDFVDLTFYVTASDKQGNTIDFKPITEIKPGNGGKIVAVFDYEQVRKALEIRERFITRGETFKVKDRQFENEVKYDQRVAERIFGGARGR